MGVEDCCGGEVRGLAVLVLGPLERIEPLLFDIIAHLAEVQGSHGMGLDINETAFGRQISGFPVLLVCEI